MIYGLEFRDPWFLLMGPIGFLIWAIGFYKPFRKGELRLPKRYLNEKGFFSKFFITVMAFVAMMLLAVSLAVPRKPAGFAKNDAELNDIFFVVDVSRSMLAEDFKPNRLEVAKRKILEFIKLMPTDRIGIIIFSEKVYTLLPLTTDLSLIEKIIDEIEVGGFLGGGTNIGDALALAVARGAQSLAKNKTVILLTDGVSNVGFMTPMQAAEEAKNQNMKVYTIAVGGSEDALMPVGQVFGRKQYQTIPGGAIDLETLKKIAELTGGKDFVASSEGSLKNVLGEIEKLEKTKIEISGKVIYTYKHYGFLFWGIILFVLTELSRRLMLREGE